MTTNPTPRQKAIRATRAVTLGGFALAAACGTTPDAGGDIGSDVEPDSATDATVDVTDDAAPDVPSDVEADSPDVDIDTPEPDTRPDVEMDTPPDVHADTPPDVEMDTPPDVEIDTTVDVAPDIAPDVTVDVSVDVSECSGDNEDELCPAGCGEDEDVDCCYANWGGPELCEFSLDWGCQCAAVGPFAPPRFDASAQ